MTLHEVLDDTNKDEPEIGPCLGFVPYNPNLMVHDQTDDILKHINSSLRVDAQNRLVAIPPPEYTGIKLVRYTQRYNQYELSYKRMVIHRTRNVKGNEVHKSGSFTIVSHQYLITKP